MKFQAIFVFCALLHLATGYKILFLVPFHGKSHWILLERIIDALLERHHHVTAITNFKWNGPKPENYTEILIDPPLDFEKHRSQAHLFQQSVESPFKSSVQYLHFCEVSADYGLSSANVQAFLKRTDQQFDVVVNEEFFHDSYLMFGHKFSAPIVTISTYGYSEFFDWRMGLATPFSHVPHAILDFGDEMTFAERLYNVALSIFDAAIVRPYFHLPRQTAVAERHFGHLGPLPSLDSLNKNISLTLVYTHRSISYPRPSMPGLISIGGAHIKPTQPLPADLQEFLDGAKNGAVFFSLGTFLKSSSMSKHHLTAFLHGFKRLKQRVIWKFDDDTLPDLPSNVMIRKWLPQNDILAHPNTVLFISHGGVFGSVESVWHGVPMLLIPFFGDQHRNAMRAVRSGYGKVLPYFKINNETLLNGVHELLTNPTYLNKAKEVSKIFKTNPIPPMQEAMFWIEYVCQFRGAQHLKSAAVHMNWFAYLLLDVWLVVGLAGFSVVFLVFLVVRCCCGCCCRTNSQSGKRKTE